MAGRPTEVTSGVERKAVTTNLTILRHAMCIKPLAPPETYQAALDVTANVSDKTVFPDGVPDIYRIYEHGRTFPNSGP